jgi:hypothetical protein
MIALKKIYATPYLVVYWQQAGGLNPDVLAALSHALVKLLIRDQ